jgi:putative oxidoreductase
MDALQSLGKLLGRLLIATIFALSAYGKVVGWSGTAAYMSAHGMTLVPLFLGAATLIEFLGAVGLIFGYKTRLAALLLAIYLIPVTWLFHNFWDLEGADRYVNQLMFLKNLAIIGGLLFISSTGPGKFAVDRCCKSSSTAA